MPQPLSNDEDHGVLIGKPGEKLADALYASIRDAVVFGMEVDQGERIYPKDLSERFNVSPTPVREALMRLAAEGYIESIPRRGFRIRKPSPEQVRDLWEVRLGLEVNAGELAIGRMKAGEVSRSEIGPLSGIIEKSDKDWERLSGREQIELNTQFHSRIVELSGNELLKTIYHGIQLQYVSSRVRQGVDNWRVRREAEMREHRAIVSALSDCDEDAYRIAAKTHVLRSLNDALTDVAAS